MKILYVGCHAVLEYDEVKLFSELGYEIQCNGGYRDPRGAFTLPRPGIASIPFDQEFFDWTAVYPKTDMPAAMIEKYDTIIFMSGEREANLIQNWPKIKHKRVILRMIGQSTEEIERSLAPLRAEGLEIVRYSPKEHNIPMYQGGDEMIRFYKDPEEFKDWTGEDVRPISFVQSLRGRGTNCHYDEIMGSMVGFPNAKVYGSGNNDIGQLNGGEMPYENLKEIMRKARVFVYAGTWPASYTLSFIEALMTGIPMVVISKRMAQMVGNGQLQFYEVDEIIKDGVNGFVCDSVGEMRERIKQLLEDHELAKRISAEGRTTAIGLFGKEAMSLKWKNFLEKKPLTLS